MRPKAEGAQPPMEPLPHLGLGPQVSIADNTGERTSEAKGANVPRARAAFWAG